MKRSPFHCLAVILLLVGFLGRHADAQTPAGIVLYAKHDGQTYLLLADHEPPSQRGWAAFGGTHEKGETSAQTAARETEEETRGVFPRAELMAEIQTQTPVYDGLFAFYFVKVDYLPIATFDRHVSGAAYNERGPYAWIPWSEIQRLLAVKGDAPPHFAPGLLPADKHTDWAWSLWLHNLRAAATQHAIPWETKSAAQ